jgi:hypothetical protein
MYMSNIHLIKINKHAIYTSQFKCTTINIHVKYHYYIGPPEPEVSMPLLPELEGISVPMSDNNDESRV